MADPTIAIRQFDQAVENFGAHVTRLEQILYHHGQVSERRVQEHAEREDGRLARLERAIATLATLNREAGQ